VDQSKIILLVSILIILLLLLDAYRRVQRKKYLNKNMNKMEVTEEMKSSENKPAEADSAEIVASSIEETTVKTLDDELKSVAVEEYSNENIDKEAVITDVPKRREDVYSEPGYPSLEQGIIVLHVMAPRGYVFYGDDLAQIFYDHQFSYGDSGSFQAISQSGEVIFDVVSAIEPGTFDIENMHEVQTPGVTIFMDATTLQDPKSDLKRMLAVMCEISEQLGATLLNEQRCRFTQSDVSRYLARIKNMDTKSS